MINKFSGLIISAVFLSAAMLQSCALTTEQQAVSKNTEAEVTLRVHHFLDEDSLTQKSLLEPWAARVEAASEGRIKVEITADMLLGGKAWDLVAQAKDGTVDIIWTAAAYTPDLFPKTSVFSLPIVHQGNAVATNLAIHELLDKELSSDFKGLHPLLIHVHAGHVFHMVDKEFTSLVDLQGLTIRPPGSKGVERWSVEQLGASPTKKRHPSLPAALRNKQLDGALLSFRLADTMGIVEAVKSHTLFGEDGSFGTSLYILLMNQQSYASLPDDLKQIIDQQSGKALAKEMGQIWQKGSEQALQHAGKQGNSIHVLSKSVRDDVYNKQLGILNLWVEKIHGGNQDEAKKLIKKASHAVKKHEL